MEITDGLKGKVENDKNNLNNVINSDKFEFEAILTFEFDKMLSMANLQYLPGEKLKQLKQDR